LDLKCECYNKNKNQAFLIHGGIAGYYLNHYGYRNFGPPTSNEIIGNYAGGNYGQHNDKMVFQKFSRFASGKEKTIVWNERTGNTEHLPIGFCGVNSPSGALCYKYQNGNWNRWPNSWTTVPTGLWLVDVGSHTFILRDVYGNMINNFTLLITEGNLQYPNVDPKNPLLSVSPTSLNFGSSSTTKTFIVKNTGGGTLIGTVSDNQSWISVNSSSLNLSAGQNKTITVNITRSNLSIGTNTGTVFVNSNGGNRNISISATKDPPPDPTDFYLVLEAENMNAEHGADWGGYWNLWANGKIYKNVNFPTSQNYDFKIRAMGSYANNIWPNMKLKVGSSTIGSTTVASSSFRDYNFSSNISSGNQEVAIYFTNDYYNPPNEDRNLFLDKITISSSGGSDTGPDPDPPSPDPEILIDENFNNGLGLFVYEINNNANATIYASNGNAVINIVGETSTIYDVQLKVLFPIKRNEKYHIEFKIKADRNRSVCLQICKEIDPWTHYDFWEDVNLDQSWKSCSYDFTANHTDSKARFTFHCGNEVGKIFIHYVKISKIQPLLKDKPELPKTVASSLKNYSLSQNYPNPFNPETTISFSISNQEFVILKIYNMLGNEVATLVKGLVDQGEHKVIFNKQLPAGIYFYQIKAGEFTQTKKMIFAK